MCGIAGFVGPGDRAILRRMTDALRHRGPDAEGSWVDEAAAVFLGHRRLSIVDLGGGAQPMWTRDGRIGVVFNGEIYNHAELREELRALGREFLTDHSDTEVLLHSYAEWGDAFVERLNGMWAFVIYDRSRRRLFGSRDRFGKKPIYYFHEGAAFGFASELPALLRHPSCPREVSPLSLQKYFAHCYVPAPRSIYERVWKLPGGHSFNYELDAVAAMESSGPLRGKLTVWKWWEFILEPDERLTSAVSSSGSGGGVGIVPPFVREMIGGQLRIETLCEEIRATLERSVQRRLMSDVPLGVFLSGGLDSSAIAALAAKHLPAGQLNTFSIGFNDASFDESSYARLVAQRLGTQHHEEILDLDNSLALLPEIIGRLDEPFGDGSLLPTYLLSRFTRQHVTVALGGDGGDELFAGYDPFKALKNAERYSKLIPGRVHEGIRMLAGRLKVSHANMSFDFKVKRALMGLSYRPELWNAVWMSALEPRDLTELFREPVDEEEVFSEAIEAWERCAQPNLVDRALQFWTNVYLQDGILAKVDRASMMCSLEARSPFLDLEMADLARRIPWQLKLRGKETKWILKRALRPLLPAEIIDRPKKGFGMPIGRWMREGKFEFDHTRTFPHLGGITLAKKKIAAHRAGTSDERLFLWSYWVLSEWLRR